MPQHATRTSFKPGHKIPYKPIKDRLLSKIRITETDCWEWTGCLYPGGYACIGINGKARPAHIISYEEFIGPIPNNMELDHLCHNPKNCAGGPSCPHRRCINPAHLEPVSKQENIKRGHGNSKVVANRIARTHCKNGHLYDEANTYWYRGYRMCRACHAATERKRQANQRH